MRQFHRVKKAIDMQAEEIRRPAVAGQFYPAEPDELKADLVTYLEKAQPAGITAPIRGLIVPHAGYMFSGQTAACAYRQVQGAVHDAIVVVAPSHRDYFKGAVAYQGKGYQTPLGVVPVDQVLAQAITGHTRFLSLGTKGHGLEHALEVQLPFIQSVQPGVPIVPIVMGDQGSEVCTALAKAIAAAGGARRLLLVASSDLSHFHGYQEARELDAVVNQYLNGFDPEGLARALTRGECEACGGGPMVTVMLAARQLGARQAQVLHHVNSGDISGDKSGVVGYTAAVIY